MSEDGAVASGDVHVTEAALYRYSLPLVRPLVLGGAVVHRREGLLVRLTGERGGTGWGEAAPLPGFSRETLEESAACLAAVAPALEGRRLSSGEVASAEALGEAPPASVQYGVALALWRLWAAESGTAPAHLFTPAPRPVVALGGLLAGTPEEVLRRARRLRAAGYAAVKLKVGRGPVAADVDLVRSLSRVLGPGVRLRLDANRAWSLEDASAFVRGTAGCPFEYLEEPLADASALSAFAARYDVPVALDESLVGMAAADLGAHGYARAVVLKPTLLGPSSCLRLARQARAMGMAVVVSSAFESGIGLGGLVELAAGLGEGEPPAGLDTYGWLAEDVLDPRPDLQGPMLRLEALRRPSTVRLDVLQRL